MDEFEEQEPLDEEWEAFFHSSLWRKRMRPAVEQRLKYHGELLIAANCRTLEEDGAHLRAQQAVIRELVELLENPAGYFTPVPEQ